MKIGRGCLQVVVVYERFQLEGFVCENFGVLGCMIRRLWEVVTYNR